MITVTMFVPHTFTFRRRGRPASRAAAVCSFVCHSLVAAAMAVARGEQWPPDFAGFQAEVSPTVSRRLAAAPRHYRQIEPSLFHL